MKFLSVRKLRRIAALLFAALLLFPCFANAARREGSPVFKTDTRRVLVIDPGHGGEDGGAVSLTGALESEINLDIAKKLDAIAGLFGVPVVLTRDSEKLDYPSDASTIRARKRYDTQRRTELVNSTENAVLLSIHQNIYPSPQPHGAQVLHAKTEGSRELAEFTQERLRAVLDPQNKRTAIQASGDIYLMSSIKRPGILVECAFLSNPAENALMQSDVYRLRVSWVIASAYLGFYGGTNES